MLLRNLKKERGGLIWKGEYKMNELNLKKIRKEKPIDDLLRFSIININKPCGPTSFSVSHYIQRKIEINKTSHFGTLDPQVSGVLPVALSRACRLNEYFVHRNKTYVGIMRLHKEIEKEMLDNVIKRFIGKIKQLPPIRSKVKRAIREREIASFGIREIEGKDVLFETEVEAGTYIRKLCDDIGKEIGGAHMLELRRTKASIFQEEESIDLYEFDRIWEKYKSGDEKDLRERLIPGESVCLILPIVHIQKQVVKKALSGSPLFPSFLEKENKLGDIKEKEKICVFCEDKFIGCYGWIGGESILAKPEFIFN